MRMSTQNKNQSSGKTNVSREERNRRKKTRNIILIAVEIVILLLLAGVCVYLFGDSCGLGIGSKKGKGDSGSNNPFTNKVSDEDGIPLGANEEIVQSMGTDNQEAERENPMKNYRLIALFGVDSRVENLTSGNNRSDTIMIAAINKETNDIKLVSVYRDTYLNVGDDYYCKCNTAYALGGYEQAVTMLNSNLDLYIEDYITIGFAGLIDAVDALGGIYIDVDSSEISHLNNYQICMAEELERNYTEVTETGYQLLNGIQATAYCRIRYTKGDDYKRAERQREVIMALLEKAKTSSLSALTEAANKVIKEVSTSLSLNDILDVLGVISKYDITTQGGFPEESMRTSGTIGSKGSCVVPVSLAKNVKWLHQFLFEDDEYEVSAMVESYSNTIYSQTYQFLGELVNEK